MDPIFTHLGEKFAAQSLKMFFCQAVAPMITNTEWEGTLKGGGADRVNILTFGKMTLQDYVCNTDMTLTDPMEFEEQLVVDQQKAYYFKLDDLCKFESYVNDSQSTLMQTAAQSLVETIDTYVLAMGVQAAAGNIVGTDYTTGTVTVDVTTGNVTGSGTTFDASMVGKGFQSAGQTQSYRVKTFVSPTNIVIEDDVTGAPSAYTGGAIAGGATFSVNGATPIALTPANMYANILALKCKLDTACVPKSDRWIVVNCGAAALLLQSPQLTRSTSDDTGVIRNGEIGRIAGFTIYESEMLPGDNAGGWQILAGHKSAITFALAFTESGVEDVPKQFAKAYKGLSVYGAKVLQERRKALAVLSGTV